jgi:hypothetical protein
MKPFIHAQITKHKYGGKVEDYIAIHNFIDSPKIAYPNIKHRAILHNSFGCYLVEQIFGITLVNSDNRTVSTRDIAEQHIIDDLGYIPTVEDWLENLEIKDWMSAPVTRTKTLNLKD